MILAIEKARMISTNPAIAQIKRFLAAAAPSGLPEERINWIPETTMKMTVKNPAMPKTAGRKPVIAWVIKWVQSIHRSPGVFMG